MSEKEKTLVSPFPYYVLIIPMYWGPYSPNILTLCLILNDFGMVLANQKLCYIPLLLIVENSGEQDRERYKEWLLNMDPESFKVGTVWYWVRK